MSSKLVNEKLDIPWSKHIFRFYLLCQFRRLLSDCSREDNEIPSIFDSCSQKAPYSRAVYITSSKIKFNIGSCYINVDKLSCNERCDLVHNV